MEPEDIIIYILRIRSLNMEFEDLKKKLKKSFKREPLYIEANGLDDKKEAVNKLLDLKELKKFSTDTEWIDGEIKKGDNYFEDMYPSLHSLVDLPLVVNYKPNNEILNNKVYKCFEKFLIDKGLLTPPNDEADESLDKDVEIELEPASSMGAESAGPDGSSDPSASVELHDISPAVSSVSSVRPSDSGINVDGRVGKITGFEKKPVGKNVYTIYFDDGTLENLKLNDHVWKILQQTVGSEGGFRRSKPRQNKTKRIANCKTKRKMKRKTKLNKRKTIRKTKLNKRKTKRKKKTRL